MPAYSNTNPPYALFPGDVGFSFNNEAFPGSAQAGQQFAVPEPAGFPNQGHTIVWQTVFGTVPSAVSIQLEGAMADVDSEYFKIDGPSTATLGEQRTVPSVRARFLRIKFNSSTGGAGLTAKLAL
jgi:hypothetical protein